jgi:hypothetical protein
MKPITNRFVQEQIANNGELVKACWSIAWQKGEVYLSDLIKKSYNDNLVRQAMLKLVKKGFLVKPKNTRNYWKVAKNIVKG